MTDVSSLSPPWKQEAGGSLPSVLIAIGVGALLLAPFLAHVSSRMLATRAAEDDSAQTYAADSGIEYAIWHLDNDPTYRAAVDSGTDSPLTLTVNGEAVSVESTALPLGAWTELADTLDTVGAGGALAAGGDGRIYALRGNNTRQAWRYNPTADSWSDFGVTDAPDAVGAGGSLVHTGGGQFFALRGNNEKDFWGYDSGSDTWDLGLKDFAGSAGDGAGITHDGGNVLYSFRGRATTSFRLYEISNDKWKGAPEAPGTVSSGGAAVFANDLVYAFHGGGSVFWAFDPSQGADGAWLSGGSDPADAPDAVGSGAALAWDGGDFIYAFQGGDSTTFWRYSISGDSWEVMTNAPAAVGAGGAMTYGGSGTVFALQGSQETGFWKFEITPPRYDIQATAGDTTIVGRVEFDGSDISIIFWDIQ